MIVWNGNDLLEVALLVLIILVSLLIFIVAVIKDKIHNIFRRNKSDKKSKEVEIYDINVLAFPSVVDKQSILRIKWVANIGFGQYDIIFTNEDDNGDYITTKIEGDSEYLDSNTKKEFIRLLFDKLVDKMVIKED